MNRSQNYHVKTDIKDCTWYGSIPMKSTKSRTITAETDGMLGPGSRDGPGRNFWGHFGHILKFDCGDSSMTVYTDWNSYNCGKC